VPGYVSAIRRYCHSPALYRPIEQRRTPRGEGVRHPANTWRAGHHLLGAQRRHTPWAGAGHYAIYMMQAIAPMHECRNDRAIFAELAQLLGINDYDDKTEEQWLRDLTKDAVDDFEAFKEADVARFAPPKDAVAFADQIRDPDSHKFTTPSGKIEIYSMAMAARPDRYGLGAMPPIPTWFDRSRPTRSTR
jgi:anaerobic dimethyl sulfoxide reductase subunit A